MDRFAEILKILNEEYGISTDEELRNALRKLGGIDITPLCKQSKELKGAPV